MVRCIVKDCKYNAFASVKALYLHIQICHQWNINEKIMCPEKKCYRDFKGWRTFRRHLISFHKVPSVLHSNYKSNEESNINNGIVPDCDDQNMAAAINNQDVIDDAVSLIDDNTKSFELATSTSVQDFVMSFISKLYATPGLPRNIIQIIVDEMHDLLNNISSFVIPSIMNDLKNVSVDENVLIRIKKGLNILTKPFMSMETEYQRFKNLFSTKHFIQATDYVVGSRFDEKLINGCIRKEMCDVKAKFISIKAVLQQLLSLSGVLDIILNYMESLENEKELLSNFIQGEIWQRKKQLYYKDKIVIPLFLFFDDFEVNNPLGSHATIQKLGAVFYFIPCMPPQVSSQLNNIFLALLFHSADRNQFQNSSIFGILVDEINDLQRKGLYIPTKTGFIQVFFALGLILGDNLGLNSALDFAEGFNATYYCRLCKMSQNEAHSCVIEKENLLRTEINYNDDIKTKSFKDSGIKQNSIWNKIDYFHVTSNAMVDKMHDLDEGVYKYGMAHILYHYIIQTKKISLSCLNERLKAFDYGSNNITNKPPLITDNEIRKKDLKFSASEMSNFLLLFPFLVGEDVPHDDVWQYFLSLRKIHDIVNAKYLQKECAELLEVLVAEHNEKYMSLFCDNLKCKHHNLTHYKTVMKKSGPLSHLSVMRFESKNRLLKLAANATCSRKNITHTLIVKEQLNLCHRFLSNTILCENQKMGPIVFIGPIFLIDEYQLIKSSLSPTFTGKCMETTWVQHRGIIYKPNLCVVIDILDDLPQFGIIQKILCNESDDLCLVCQNMYTIGFNENLHGFEVQDAVGLTAVNISHLFNPFPAIVARLPLSGNLLVATKFAL
ncbi:uncharacterized protein LOC118646711 [Monomorium pharaonis]|uniref:uncharacterized protein LOC118646711 n=1 Tax=Monomorium pharaonis TaxID=307658 RepID=UPI001747508C|nr:uncharacterized protein LOC118646711 [Monomorium pharaonis]